MLLLPREPTKESSRCALPQYEPIGNRGERQVAEQIEQAHKPEEVHVCCGLILIVW